MITPPYTVETRPDTGLYNAKLGMWLFLAAELMFYGALISSYVLLRAAGGGWPAGAEVLPLKLAVLNGLVLTLVCVAISNAWGGSIGPPWRDLWTTAILGLVSSVLITLELLVLTWDGVTPATNTFYALYFVIGGIQWLHIIALSFYAAYLIGFGRTMYATEPLRLRNRIECLGLYWHFVAFMWLVILLMFYLV